MISTIQLRDENSLLGLWQREAPGLRRFFRNALSDPDTAEDLTAESFTQLAAAFERGGVVNGEALLRRIAQTQLAAEIRRRQREVPRGDLSSFEDYEPEDLVPAQQQHLTAEMDEFRGEFDRAVRSLDGTRDAFILTELRGLSTHEAAPILGVSQPTVAAQRRAALQEVQDLLTE